MSNRELELTQTIADMAYMVSTKSGLSIEEALNFVYNSNTLEQIVNGEADISDYSQMEQKLIKELQHG